MAGSKETLCTQGDCRFSAWYFIFVDKRKQLETLGSRKITTTSTRFDGTFFRVFSKYRHPGKLHCSVDSPDRLGLLSLWKEVKPSPDREMV